MFPTYPSLPPPSLGSLLHWPLLRPRFFFLHLSHNINTSLSTACRIRNIGPLLPQLSSPSPFLPHLSTHTSRMDYVCRNFCSAVRQNTWLFSPPVTVPRLPHSPAAEMAHENVRVITSTLLRHVHVSPHSPVSLRTCIHTHVTHTKRAPAKFGCADVIFTYIWRHIVRMSPASP